MRAGALKLVPLATTASPPGKSLQLWTKADGWKGPVSLGLVEPGKAVDVSLAKLPPLQPNQLFEITLEPQSGSPIGRADRADPVHRPRGADAETRTWRDAALRRPPPCLLT